MLQANNGFETKILRSFDKHKTNEI